MVDEAIRFLSSLIGRSDEEIAPHFLGAGSTREAYAFNDDYVIKIPRFIVRLGESSDYTEEQIQNIIRRGVRQTKTEIKVFNKCSREYRYLLNPIVAKGTFMNLPFVIMPRLKIASKVVDFSIENIIEFIEVLDLCVPTGFDIDLLCFASDYSLYHSDLRDNMDNFGIDGSNHIFITDYGFEERKKIA